MNKKAIYKTVCTITFALMGNIIFGQIDKDATKETKALYKNLKEISKKNILFAHQHATEYGHGWNGDVNRSDVKSVTGSYPAMVGVDFSGLSGRPEADIEKTKERQLHGIFQIQLLRVGFIGKMGYL